MVVQGKEELEESYYTFSLTSNVARKRKLIKSWKWLLKVVSSHLLVVDIHTIAIIL